MSILKNTPSVKPATGFGLAYPGMFATDNAGGSYAVPVGNAGTLGLGQHNLNGGMYRNTNRYTNSVDIEEGVFKMPVRALLDLWTIRFGNKWVNMSDIQDDSTYAVVYTRLKQLGKIEQHFLTDVAREVVRLPE